MVPRCYGKGHKAPWSHFYWPELDVSPILDAEQANCYQSQLGILWWIMELGRINTATKVSMLAAHNALPREGHLAAVFWVYSYLKTQPNPSHRKTGWISMAWLRKPSHPLLLCRCQSCRQQAYVILLLGYHHFLKQCTQWICCAQDCNWDAMRPSLQALHNGHPNCLTIIHSLRKQLRHHQKLFTCINPQEEVQLNCLSLCPRVCGSWWTVRHIWIQPH